MKCVRHYPNLPQSGCEACDEFWHGIKSQKDEDERVGTPYWAQYGKAFHGPDCAEIFKKRWEEQQKPIYKLKTWFKRCLSKLKSKPGRKK
jgi:hypothetical protein